MKRLESITAVIQPLGYPQANLGSPVSTNAGLENYKCGISPVTLFSLQSPVFARLPGFETEGSAIGVLPP